MRATAFRGPVIVPNCAAWTVDRILGSDRRNTGDAVINAHQRGTNSPSAQASYRDAANTGVDMRNTDTVERAPGLSVPASRSAMPSCDSRRT